MKKLISLVLNCAEVPQLHEALLQNQDCMTQLVRLLECSLKDKYKVEEEGLKTDIIIPVLKSFILLSVEDEFPWHLTKHSALELLKNMRVH